MKIKLRNLWRLAFREIGPRENFLCIHIYSYSILQMSNEYPSWRLVPVFFALMVQTQFLLKPPPPVRGLDLWWTLCSIHIEYTGHTPHTLHFNTKHTWMFVYMGGNNSFIISYTSLFPASFFRSTVRLSWNELTTAINWHWSCPVLNIFCTDA